MLARCQDGYEELLSQELCLADLTAVGSGTGWVRFASGGEIREVDWCFPHAILDDETEVGGASVNALAGSIASHFFESARAERFEEAWPLVFTHASSMDGLGRRASAVEAAVRELLRKRMARVAKLATATAPRCGTSRGLFVFLEDFGRASLSRTAWFGGQCRMADDPGAPSRSYLKVEEAYGIIGAQPAAGETVIDLGAAPGGWSYSAARRGASVIAIDNGPMKGGALGHPGIEHRREDAFRFRLPAGEACDWLFCDLVEEPHHVLHAIVEPWLRAGLCRRFIVNLKFGRADAIALLTEARSTLGPHVSGLRVRHLFHDREEFTLVGMTRKA